MTMTMTKKMNKIKREKIVLDRLLALSPKELRQKVDEHRNGNIANLLKYAWINENDNDGE